MNCSGIQSFLFGVILQTARIVVQYTFLQFLTPISSGFVRNPGVVVPGERWEVEFLTDGSVEVEKFISNGEISEEEALNELFARYLEPENRRELISSKY